MAAMRLLRDFSLSTVTAGFVAVLVGFSSSVVLVFQAAQAFGATPAILASWMWALGLGVGVCTLVPSLWLRQPVMVAWSTPGAAVLASAGLAGGFSMGEAVGAFMVSAALVIFVGVTGLFSRLMARIPVSLSSALLAGVLAKFGMQAFAVAKEASLLLAGMLLAYLLARRLWPRYAVVVTLAVGMVLAWWAGDLRLGGLSMPVAQPVFVQPKFTWGALVSLALPLFVVTMASQNMPGVAAIQAAGYGGQGGIPVSRVLTMTGVVTLLLAPLGAFALNFSAITAAICMGPEAHSDARRRYTAAVVCGALYMLVGCFGAAVAEVLAALPTSLVMAIAGLALLGSIGSGLTTAFAHPEHREAALITFLVTLSGVVIGQVGSPFWGVVAGVLALLIQHVRPTVGQR